MVFQTSFQHLDISRIYIKTQISNFSWKLENLFIQPRFAHGNHQPEWSSHLNFPVSPQSPSFPIVLHFLAQLFNHLPGPSQYLIIKLLILMVWCSIDKSKVWCFKKLSSPIDVEASQHLLMTKLYDLKSDSVITTSLPLSFLSHRVFY